MSKVEQKKSAFWNWENVLKLLDDAFDSFHNPIVIFDTNYDLLAYTDSTTDDPFWNELITTGTFSMETQAFFANEYFSEDIANAEKLTILKSDKLKYTRMSGYIKNKDNIKVAGIVMIECNTTFSENVQAAFEELIDGINEEIRNEEYFTVFGRTYHESIINKLLEGVIKDPKFYTPQIQVLYDGFCDYLYLAVVDVTQSGKQQDSLERFKDLLQCKYRLFKFAVYSGYIIMIMSSKDRIRFREAFFIESDNFFEQNNLFMGISSDFESLYELREHYDKAVDALKKGLESNSTERVFFV